MKSEANLKSDESFMALALREAEKGMYTSHPNPRVGCVLVKNGEVIAKGFHLKTGSGHAEANAIEAAGKNAKGAIAYVTLEPCSFVGRTPACADALIKAGVKRVVYAMLDPHPDNTGAGIEKLRQAKIEIEGPILEASARALNPGHVKKFELGMPFVRLKLAMSLDGKTALANGQSQWITGEAARRDVHRLRARSSAIVTGVQTVVDDNPALSVRANELAGGEMGADEASFVAGIERKIVVLDPERRIPIDAKLLGNPSLILATLADPKQHTQLDVEQIQLPDNGQRRIDLLALLKALADRDCNEVLFECGATLAGSLISENLVDELVIYMAPKLMGDKARSLLDMDELSSMEDVLNMAISDIRLLGKDIRITATLKN